MNGFGFIFCLPCLPPYITFLQALASQIWSYIFFNLFTSLFILLSHFGGIYKSLVYPASNSSRDGHTSIHQSSSGIFKGAPKGLAPTSYSNAYCIATWLNQIFHRELRLSGEEWEGEKEGEKKKKNIYNLCTANILRTVLKEDTGAPQPLKRIGLHPNPMPLVVQRPLRFTRLSKEARDSMSPTQFSLCVLAPVYANSGKLIPSLDFHKISLTPSIRQKKEMFLKFKGMEGDEGGFFVSATQTLSSQTLGIAICKWPPALESQGAFHWSPCPTGSPKSAPSWALLYLPLLGKRINIFLLLGFLSVPLESGSHLISQAARQDMFPKTVPFLRGIQLPAVKKIFA